MTDNLRAIAEAFVSARRDARALAAYPGVPPADLAQAYRVQDHAIRLDGRFVAGWKVGRIFPPDDARFGADRLAGPIFADMVLEARGAGPAMAVFANGFAAAEAELLLHVAPGHRGALPRNDDETRALLDDVRIGIEIASSPFPGINDAGPTVTASDFGNNFGLVLGSSVVDWRRLDMRAVSVRTEIDGTLVGEQSTAAMLDGPFGAVRFLLDNLTARGIDFSQGTWVSSGAITGVHPVRPGQHVHVDFGALGGLSCDIMAVGQVSR